MGGLTEVEMNVPPRITCTLEHWADVNQTCTQAATLGFLNELQVQAGAKPQRIQATPYV